MYFQTLNNKICFQTVKEKYVFSHMNIIVVRKKSNCQVSYALAWKCYQDIKKNVARA